MIESKLITVTWSELVIAPFLRRRNLFCNGVAHLKGDQAIGGDSLRLFVEEVIAETAFNYGSYGRLVIFTIEFHQVYQGLY